MGYIHE